MKGSKIEWTHHTWNPWWGCTKVSPGCLNCYAETLDARFHGGQPGGAHWGRGVPRKEMSDNYWRQPLAWDRAAKAAGERHRVFCASMADVFDAEVPAAWRERLWALIRQTPNLDWLLLTKRPENISRMLPRDWGLGGPLGRREGYPNVWLGTSVEDQKRADERIPLLCSIPATVRFLSCEPLLEEVTLRNCGPTMWAAEYAPDHLMEYLKRQGHGPIHWAIVGGESGQGARPFRVEWARRLREECAEKGVAFFFKQFGTFESNPAQDDSTAKENGGDTKGGRLLDGRTWDEVPTPRVVA